MLRGGDSLTSYFKIGNRNQKDLHLSSSSLRPNKALEEAKSLETQDLDLKIDKPNLNINNQIKSSSEKEDIKTIYKEIKKEKEVIKIELDKDKQYKNLREGLESHKEGFSNFSRGVPKKIKKMLKRQRRETREEARVRVRRFSIVEDSEELNVLKEIGQINQEEKKAIVEFYKSYLRAIQEKEGLLTRLDNIDSSQTKKRKARNTNNLESNLYFLDKTRWSNSKIDLSENSKETPPETLLSSKLFELMKREYKKGEDEIQGFNYGLGYLTCSLVFFRKSSSKWAKSLCRQNSLIKEKTKHFKRSHRI